MKKIIFSLVVLLLVGIGVWYFFLRTVPTPPVPDDSFPTFPGGDDTGNTPGGTGNTPPGQGNEPGTPSATNTPRMRKLADGPVAGYESSLRTTLSIIDGKEVKEQTPIVHYIERETGNVYEVDFGGTLFRRITNTTIPRVHDAAFGENGGVILRYLASDDRTIRTFVGKFPLTGEVGDLSGSYIEDNVIGYAVSPDKKSFFALVDDSGRALGLLHTFSAPEKSSNIFSYPFVSWQVMWTRPDAITLVPKASRGTTGSAFSLTVKTGAFSKIFPRVKSLLGFMGSVDAQGTHMLWSNILGSGSVQTSIVAAGTEPFAISLTTLAEKCVWGETRVYCAVPKQIGSGAPDSWYQGQTSFSDDFWAIDKDTGSTVLLASPKIFGFGAVDGVKLSLDKAETHLFFTDKQTGRLFIVDLR